MLQSVQQSYGIYNSDIEPEHEVDWYCSCLIHQYKNRKMNRLGVQSMWASAVMYPGQYPPPKISTAPRGQPDTYLVVRVGEKNYHDCYQMNVFSSNNPYRFRVVSPYNSYTRSWGVQRPNPRAYSLSVNQTIQLNASLNSQAQSAINAQEPSFNIWEIDELAASVSKMTIASAPGQIADNKRPVEKTPNGKRQSMVALPTNSNSDGAKPSRFAGLKKALAMKSPEEKEAARIEKMSARARELRTAILQEENGRWPDQEWRQIVAAYQEKVGMTRKIAHLRTRQPTQYLHLLRAGYFEPIPVAWANLASNPLKFSIEAAAGWRGITPAWRGYEDTAEERLYWVLNHREGSAGVRLKPDIMSAMNMARARMASAVEPPPAYFTPNDTCHLQHTSEGYSKQVMPPPFRAYDAPEVSTDDTMILLDVSGSMDFDPLRPNYNEYLITGYSRSTQPKNKGDHGVMNRSNDILTFLLYRCRQGHHPPFH